MKVRQIHEYSTYGAAKRHDVSGSYGHLFTFLGPPHRGNEKPSPSPQNGLLAPSPDPGPLLRVENPSDVIASLIKEYMISRMKSTTIVVPGSEMLVRGENKDRTPERAPLFEDRMNRFIFAAPQAGPQKKTQLTTWMTTCQWITPGSPLFPDP